MFSGTARRLKHLVRGWGGMGGGGGWGGWGGWGDGGDGGMGGAGESHSNPQQAPIQTFQMYPAQFAGKGKRIKK